MSPTSPSPTPTGGATILLGQTVSAVDGAAAPNLSVQIGSSSVTSDGSGFFEVDLTNAGILRATVRGSSIVDRETRLTQIAAQPIRLALIPTSFDLGAFDEMFRASNSRLQRWTSRPSLVILAAAMDYTSRVGDSYAATAEQMSDEEVAQMAAQVTEGLALLTGNTFPSFASVEVERPAAGTHVNALRQGKIVVGRYTGILTGARTVGYGQWSEMPDGTIVGGAMYLDRDFDKNDSRRRLLRIHELGHALGYNHVQKRTSIMNSAIGPEPNDFDRSAAAIAFQRPIGNHSPDVDPVIGTYAASTGGSGRWSRPSTDCRW